MERKAAVHCASLFLLWKEGAQRLDDSGVGLFGGVRSGVRGGRHNHIPQAVLRVCFTCRAVN
jgi:hypothetical protein